MKYCPNCGTCVNEEDKFCNECGKKINEQIDTDDTKAIKSSSIIKAISNSNEDSKNNTGVFNSNVNTNNSESNFDELKKIEEYIDELKTSVKIHFDNDDIIYEDVNETNQKKNHNSNLIIKQNQSDKIKLTKNNYLKYLLIIATIILLTGILSYNTIRSNYFIMKCTNSINETDKINFATKAVLYKNNEKTLKLLKNTIIDISQNDLELAEKKLNELDIVLEDEDRITITKDIKEKKIDNLCVDYKYDEILNEYSNLNDLGIDFKKNSHYDDVMLNIIAKLTNSPVRGNKGILMDDSAICYENLDDDIFDEIIEVKENIGYKSNPEIKINLYKYKEGKYKLVDSKPVNNSYDKGIQGIYKFAENKKGVYIHYNSESVNSFATSVYEILDEKIILKGTVYGTDFTRPIDIDNDGIYEIVANNLSFNNEDTNDNLKYYKINQTSTTPVEVKPSNKNLDNLENKVEYIFSNSNKEYLTEEDLRDLSKEQLALARNEIFARHGYDFKEEPFKSYFKEKEWYNVDKNYKGDDSVLNKYEIHNYKVIQQWEQK